MSKVSDQPAAALRRIEESASIIYLMGLDHLKVTYPHNGRSERATAIDGGVVKEIVA